MKYSNIFYLSIIMQLQAALTTRNNYKDSLEEDTNKYDDDKNSMIAISETAYFSFFLWRRVLVPYFYTPYIIKLYIDQTKKELPDMYEDFYDDMEISVRSDSSLNILYFGPNDSFMRLGTEAILHILSYTKKQYIPINRVLQAWDMVTDGKTAAFLQAREFLAFGSLINVVPEEDLYYTNMGDAAVLRFFANTKIELRPRKIGIFISAYRRYFGNTWYLNGTSVNVLGRLICGFPPSDLKKISPAVIKTLSVDTLNKVMKCNQVQKQTLYDIAVHPEAYGDPYRWTSHEVSRLSGLFTCIPENDISSLQLEAIPAITDEVMRTFELKKLSYFTKQQIIRMQPLTHRLYVLRMQLKNSLDVNEIVKQNAFFSRPSMILVISTVYTNLVK